MAIIYWGKNIAISDVHIVAGEEYLIRKYSQCQKSHGIPKFIEAVHVHSTIFTIFFCVSLPFSRIISHARGSSGETIEHYRFLRSIRARRCREKGQGGEISPREIRRVESEVTSRWKIATKLNTVTHRGAFSPQLVKIAREISTDFSLPINFPRTRNHRAVSWRSFQRDNTFLHIKKKILTTNWYSLVVTNILEEIKSKIKKNPFR